ncbi:hypothetical protein [Flammeovirga aprica]|uniref:Uncharacterized protein n=1 Tax=Flammeovirga aprica JL-4 TaxID=694437 RepID=A0A7X9P215_9BACT|nr:hypothetical protein [Flammeovirga aprica]NME67850.1 hypothetical protein [Flammeovirga aprica JL-4]
MNLFFYTLYGELINFIREQNIPLIDPSKFKVKGTDFFFLPEKGGKSALGVAEFVLVHKFKGSRSWVVRAP